MGKPICFNVDGLSQWGWLAGQTVTRPYPNSKSRPRRVEGGDKFKGGVYSRIHSHKVLPFRDGGSTDVITTNCLITNIVMGPGDSHKYEGIKSKLILCHVNYFPHGFCYFWMFSGSYDNLRNGWNTTEIFFFFFRILFSVNWNGTFLIYLRTGETLGKIVLIFLRFWLAQIPLLRSFFIASYSWPNLEDFLDIW